MKKFSVICVLAIFLFGANSAYGELKSSENNKTSFETLKAMLQDIDERLSNIEEKFQKEEKQLQGLGSDNVLMMKKAMVKMNKRLTKVEKKISSLDMKEIEKTLTLFEGTLDVIKERLSETTKRIEDSDVHASASENIYREHLKSLETPSKVIKEQKAESDSFEGKEIIETIEKKPRVTITKAKEEQAKIVKEESVVKLKPKMLKELEGFKKISNDFYTRNVTFAKYGPSSIVKGEVKNNSRHDFDGVLFMIKVFGENDSMIAEFDFSIKGIKSNAIKPFEETVSGVKPSEISGYEIIFKKSL
jgi:hypothetical protein